MLPVFLVELLGTVILIHQFLAKDTSKIPFSSEDCKTLRSLECINRAMVTAGKFQLPHWSKLGPLCCLLLLFDFGRQARVRGLNGRLSGSGARGADLSVGISCCGNTGPCTCAGGWPRLLTQAQPRNRGTASPLGKEGRDESEGSWVCKCGGKILGQGTRKPDCYLSSIDVFISLNPTVFWAMERLN